MNLALLIFIAVATIAYLSYIVVNYGVTKSISASYNSLQKKDKLLYQLYMLCVVVPFIIVANNGMGFLAGALLAFDYAAPVSKNDKAQMLIHCIGADVGMTLGVLMLGVIFGQWWLVAIAAIVTIILALKVKNKAWWIEIVVLSAVWTGLLIEKIL